MGKPRASGDDPRCQATGTDSPAVNPARAGMILDRAIEWFRGLRKPRASGDDPPSTTQLHVQLE